jgi:hypothetical protein
MKPFSAGLAILITSLILSSCEFHCSVGDNTPKPDGKNKPAVKDGVALYNGIKLETYHVKVKQAYLVTNDGKGETISEDNIVDMQRGVKMIVMIDSGWVQTDAQVQLGAKMKVVADNGETLLDKPDMFKPYETTGISPGDARSLGLSVYFTSWEAKRPVTMDVTFRIWDKKGDGYIDGSYTLHTK